MVARKWRILDVEVDWRKLFWHVADYQPRFERGLWVADLCNMPKHDVKRRS